MLWNIFCLLFRIGKTRYTCRITFIKYALYFYCVYIVLVLCIAVLIVYFLGIFVGCINNNSVLSCVKGNSIFILLICICCFHGILFIISLFFILFVLFIFIWFLSEYCQKTYRVYRLHSHNCTEWCQFRNWRLYLCN